ncbi:hypothetical protein C474_12736 [Halogeometricum pallidum JCM 14848]|uniref:DUF7350 domain-containing protein n=1 Tax=Halogeometricum pallidum JCM 14848 TaxID=1227487 RepID=M0D5E3_HALPD|nr:iron transporter [Halogeometricum pallidum]ELZ29902.1 hypothetical protein C474_12736 [Halogeometricum pallidum JCM 14848]
MKRRRFLAVAGAATAGAVGGCLGGSDLFETKRASTGAGGEPPLVENRPDAVYAPTHVEGMKTAGTTDVGDLRAGVAYSYPHRFWVVEKEEDGAFVARETAIIEADSVHLMASVWDPETGRVVPNTGLSLEISKGGELVSQEVIYPMLSQRMGVHYGANFPLDGDGAYDVAVSVGGVDANRFGAYEGKFGTPAEGAVGFEFSARALNDVSYRMLDDRKGERGAVEPMEMEAIPVGRAPERLPGTALGRGSTGDAVFLASIVEAARFGEDPYLAVSPRTPYNRLAIPGMALGASADGGASFSGSLAAGLDPELGFHYGAPAPGLTGSETLEITVDVPPQVARHEGYETAFLDMPPVTLT